MIDRVEIGSVVTLRTHSESPMAGRTISARVEDFVWDCGKYCVVLQVDQGEFADHCCPICTQKRRRTLYVEALLACLVR